MSSLFAEAETLKMLFTAPCVQGLRMSKVVHPRNGQLKRCHGGAASRGVQLGVQSAPHGPRIALL